MQGDKIPAEIMREAANVPRYHGAENQIIAIARDTARDTAARKECAEIARDKANRRLKAATQSIDPNTQQAQAQFGHQIATAIEATITGGGDAV